MLRVAQIKFSICLVAAAGLALFSIGTVDAKGDGSVDNTSKNRLLIAATKTTKYSNKEGFERAPKDIINTLKDNEVTRFVTLLDGLVQAFDLDKTLKNNGPFTVFAICDHGFKRMPNEDVMSLFANKKKLRQVLEYTVVEGKFDSEALKKNKKFKTLEGHEITIKESGGNLYADEALIQTVDVPCSNGIIHILDGVVMPPLSK